MSALLASVHYLNGIWINNSGKTLGLQYIHLNSGSHKNEFMYHRFYFGTRFAVAIVHSWYRLFSTVIQTTDSLSEILRLDCCENLLPCAKITSLSRRSKTRQFVASESVRRLCELDYHEQFAVNFSTQYQKRTGIKRYFQAYTDKWFNHSVSIFYAITVSSPYRHFRLSKGPI